MLAGTWLITLGSIMYLLVVLAKALASPGRIDKWLEVLGASVFVGGCAFMVKAAYPAQLERMMTTIAAPPRPLTTLERFVTSNPMLVGTQLFNAGCLPFAVEGAINMASPPADDPPGAAAQLFFGVLLCVPLLALFAYTTMDEVMRLNRGSGSTLVWDSFIAKVVLRCAGEERVRFYQCHLGSDMLCILWLTTVMFALTLTLVLPMWWSDLDDSDRLCGSISCGATLLMMGPFSAGCALMLRASYPANFGKSLFFSTPDPDEMEHVVTGERVNRNLAV